MPKFDPTKSDFVIYENSSIEDAMGKITLNQCGAILVINKDGVLVGVVSDGDIRRSMLKQATMITPVSKILNMNVISISDSENINDRSQNIFKEKTVINIIPIIDGENRLVNIAVRNKITT